jgi:glycosyltransferase involved in cell wall biosynthesis
MPEPRPTVLIYRRNLLTFSETFIHRQVRSLTRWNGVVVGTPIEGGIPLDALNYRAIQMPDPSSGVVKKKTLADKLRRFVLRTVHGSDVPHEVQAQRTAKLIQRQPWFPQLRELSPRLLHVHFGTNAEEAWPLAIALKIPMVVTLHGYDASTYPEWWESGSGGRRYRRYPSALRAMERWGAKFIVVSDALSECATSCYGLDAASMKKILIGVDTKAIRQSPVPMQERPRRVLFVGRFVEKKGVEYLIRAFPDVKSKVPDAQLMIIGEGKLGENLRSIAGDQDINFAGRQSADQVLIEMQQARVLCAPSIRASNGDSEGLPTVIPEAQASGLPVVTSDRAGSTEGLIDGVTGIGFPERDHDALVNALVRYLTDDAFAASSSVAARRFAEDKLDMAAQTLKLEEHYDRLAGCLS